MIEEVRIKTWDEFEEIIKNFPLITDNGTVLAPSLLFRGQASTSWPLEDTLFRRNRRETPVFEYYSIVSRILHSLESLTDKRWPMPPMPDFATNFFEYDRGSLALSGDLPGYEYLLFLRHNGFPSPLLDWSRSPYVAAFFAFRELSGNKDADPAIYVLKQIKTTIVRSSTETHIYRTGQYASTHARHFWQQSDYTFCASFDVEKRRWNFVSPEHFLRSDENRYHEVHKFILPRSERTSVLKALDRYNLNAYSLFGSVEALAETLAFRFFEAGQSRSNANRLKIWGDY